MSVQGSHSHQAAPSVPARQVMWQREWDARSGAFVTTLLLMPGFIFFFVLFVLPATTAVTRSATDPETGEVSWVNFQTFLGSADGWTILSYTLMLATAATITAALISLPLAEILRHKPRGNHFFRLLILTPLLLPGIVNAFGLYLFFERWGWFNKFLVDFVPFISEPWQINNTTPGLIFF